MKSNYSDIEVVLRSTNERTRSLSYDLLTNLFEPDQITIITEYPFSKCLEKSLLIGRDKGKPWLLCIDADVLISLEGINSLLERRLEVSESTFEIQGLVLDKFIPIYRPAGNHLYQTKHISRALEFIDESLRPESEMIYSMGDQGLYSYQHPDVIGIHDYYQFGNDIACKAFLHMKKHAKPMNMIFHHWVEQSITDVDFVFAIWGAIVAMGEDQPIKVDRHSIGLLFDRHKPNMPSEKGKLLEVDDLVVNKLLSSYDNKVFGHYQSNIYPEDKWNSRLDRYSAPTYKQQRGLLSKFGNILGQKVEGLGRRIKSLS